MDAMVTGRMPAGKKEAGNAVLRELGMSASQAINWLWDYLIAQRQLPQGQWEQVDRGVQLEEAIAYIDGFPELVISADLLDMDAKEIRAERLNRRYAAVEDGFSLVGEEGYR